MNINKYMTNKGLNKILKMKVRKYFQYIYTTMNKNVDAVNDEINLIPK